MSLEQSIDRLSGLIEQLIKQLGAGRSAGAAELAKAETTKAETTKAEIIKAVKDKAVKAKLAEAILDYEKDIRVKFQFLAANGRPMAVEILKFYQDKAGREGKLSEVLDPSDYQEAYDKIEAALASIRQAGA